MKAKTMADVKAHNRDIGHHFFDDNTMRFFNSRIESELIGGRYFITSERFDEKSKRLITIREYSSDGTINTVGEFQQFRARVDALDKIKSLL